MVSAASVSDFRNVWKAANFSSMSSSSKLLSGAAASGSGRVKGIDDKRSGAPATVMPRGGDPGPYQPGRSSPIRYRGPLPRDPARSPGLYSAQLLSDRHPHPMQSDNSARTDSSWPICSSIRARQPFDSRDQSAFVGTRLPGRLSSAAPISSSDSPTAWAARMTETTRMTDRG